MTHIFDDRAQEELLQQINDYRPSKAAHEFSNLVREAVQRIKDNPEIGRKIDSKGTRRVVIVKYQKAIIYQYFPDRSLIRIYAVADTRRKPGYWTGRI